MVGNTSPSEHLFFRSGQFLPYSGYMPPRKKKKTLTTFDEFMGRVVESKRVKAELTVEELADATGIGYTTLRRRLDGSGFTVLELERVAVAVETPAHRLVEEALADYGGMEKLLAEHSPASEADSTITPEDNVTYLGHVKPPLDAAADDNPRTPPKE